MAEPTTMRIFGTPEVVALTAASAASAAIGTANSGQPDLTTVVRLCSDVDCWVKVAAAPVAVVGGAGCILLPAASAEYFDIPAGEKVAGILASGTGSLSVATMKKV